MLVDVKVPVLAESVAEATLMAWHKKTGDAVKRGDSLIDIETDKVTLEVAAPNDGVLSEILKPDGSSVRSDEVIARIDSKGAATSAQPPRPIGADAPAAKAAPAPQPAPQQQSLPEVPVPAQDQRLSPAVRSLIEEHKLDPARIKATGPGGRITKEDVLAHLARPAATPPAPPPAPKAPVPAAKPAAERPPAPPVTAARAPAPAQAPPPGVVPAAEPVRATPAVAGTRPEQRVAMTRLRRRTAERLLSAQHENAILTTFNEVNMQPIMDLRNRYKKEFEETHGTRLGFMSFFTRAAVESLKKFPIINASVDGGDIIYHGYFDIGIAVSSPRGLVVPVIRDADSLSFAEVEARIRDYGEKARDGKLTIEDLTGGTFTITNGGVFGSLVSTPILNPPQSAILGMHKVQDRPVAENGQVVIRPMMYLALSYDHRIIDGRDAVQFLVAIKERIEDPNRLLLQV
ncbi:MAG: 2-oxoglutarate dehydrogenase complex dihydrolipoyllysine-residue succinyltransferase [Gammaproteobacteria bacterium]|nr:2-oxoglutarate dehydrogenase complex dihydrolipoyllysine-residue succinyltransferase [Gammaproteobacteria bacterium]